MTQILSPLHDGKAARARRYDKFIRPKAIDLTYDQRIKFRRAWMKAKSSPCQAVRVAMGWGPEMTDTMIDRYAKRKLSLTNPLSASSHHQVGGKYGS